MFVFDQHSSIGKKVEKVYRQIHGCSASPRMPTQALGFLGWNRMPELLWDVVSSWGLWNRWLSADRDRHRSAIIPSERNLCCGAPAGSSGLDRRAWRRRSGWFGGFSGFWAAQGLEAVKAAALPRLLSGLLEAHQWPGAAVGAGKTRIHQRWQPGAAAAAPESPHTARPAAFCLSQETEDRWGWKWDFRVFVSCPAALWLMQCRNCWPVLLFCAVSPERIERNYDIKNIELVCTSGMQHSCRQMEIPFSSFTQNLRTSKFANYSAFPDPVSLKTILNVC